MLKEAFAGRWAYYLANTPPRAHMSGMFNVLSILVGLFALVFAFPGLIPFFGWMNWIAVPIALVGLVIGVLSSKNTGRNLNIVVLLVAILRGSLFGGII
jgi:hypothetical protein